MIWRMKFLRKNEKKKKDEMDLPRLPEWDLNPMTGGVYKRKDRDICDIETRREGHVKTGAGIGVLCTRQEMPGTTRC